MNRTVLILTLLVAVGVSVFGYSQIMRRVGSGTPPEMVPFAQQADAIFVDKSDRILRLMKNGVAIREYRISLGGNPKGHKREEGDGRTPEGDYVIDWRNANSIAHLSLHISYPNTTDAEQAQAHDVSPGGNIMIHGILNGWSWLGALHHKWNWTNGCIAVTDAEIEEIWSLVPNGTRITIQD